MYEIVVSLLEVGDKYRDDDNKLVVRIWWDELLKRGLIPDQMTASEMLVLYRDGKLSNADSITRARRKAQEERPHLRGASYVARQHKTEDVKAEIRELEQPPMLPELFD